MEKYKIKEDEAKDQISISLIKDGESIEVVAGSICVLRFWNDSSNDAWINKKWFEQNGILLRED